MQKNCRGSKAGKSKIFALFGKDFKDHIKKAALLQLSNYLFHIHIFFPIRKSVSVHNKQQKDKK